MKIKKITVQLYNTNRGIYYKSFNGNNKNSQTIKLGKLVTANVYDPSYYGKVMYNIKFDVKKISGTSWKKFDSGTKKIAQGYNYKYIAYNKGANSIKGTIYGPNMMTGKVNEIYYTFKIIKSGSKWKASSSGWTNYKKSYSTKTYSLKTAYKKYLNYIFLKEMQGGQ